MARRTRKDMTLAEADRRDDLSYEEYSGAGARPPGIGARRNVAAGAMEREPEDYNEQNRRNVGGQGRRGIQTGNYEEDYGPGAKGRRHPQDEEPGKRRGILRRETAQGTVSEDFPTGAWATRRTSARIKRAQGGKIKARPSTGRGVGVKPKSVGRKRTGAKKPNPSSPARNASRGRAAASRAR